ncbi:MAG: hemolysin family protein [Bacteroidales bacterium]
MGLFIIILMLILSAFFSGMEIAFVSSNKLQLELDKSQEGLSSKIINIVTKNPSHYIASVLVGNNFALVIYSLAFSRLAEPCIRDFITSSDIGVLLIQTATSTLIILFLAEFLPKTLFTMNPSLIMKTFAIPLFFFYIILYPLARLMTLLSDIFLAIFKNTNNKKNTKATVFSKVDLEHYLMETSERAQKDQNNIISDIKLFRNALDFSNVRLRDIMVHRTEIEAVDINTDIDKIRSLFISTGYSKLLIYEESIDNIIGYIHSSIMFKNPSSIKEHIIQIIDAPESMQANKLLSKLIKQRKSIAVVVDEFGGTAGIVTTEDILEEITGEIEDEHDKDDSVEKQIKENEYLFSAKLELDYINEEYGLNLPVDNSYDTLAGLILSKYESMPEPNTTIEFGNFSIRIIKVSKTRIELVLLSII